MFVINFDFSSYSFVQKLVTINVPVVITELVTYPLQRLQTQLIKRQTYLTRNQITEIPMILAQMFKTEGFPKCFHGFRYSLDYSVTLMTFKFFIFDHLMATDWAQSNRYAIYPSCILANALATIASQSAFNYQTIASSLEPNISNTTESVKQRLVKFTENKSAFKNGLKYTLPVSIINSIIEVFTIINLEGRFLKSSQPVNELAPPDSGYKREELIIASIVLGLTNVTNHFAVQRQIQLCFDLKSRYSYWKGFVGSLLRNMGKGMLLYMLYFKYFDWIAIRAIEDMYTRKKQHNVLPSYYQGRTIM